MNAAELYRAGKLAEALAAQLEDVRNHPADLNKRLFLFELAAFSGDLERAGRQIDAVKFNDVQLEAAAQKYRQLVAAEKKRRQVFTAGVAPHFFSPPPPHVSLRLQALAAHAKGDAAAARELVDRADELAPEIHGTLNGAPVEGLRDADDLLGPILEVMIQGEYSWVPLEQVLAIGANPPQAPRDLIWFPARLTLHSGSEGEVFLPALYCGTHQHAEEAVRLGRQTEWSDDPAGPVCGYGLRTFVVGEDLLPLLEIRELLLDEPAGTGPAVSEAPPAEGA